MVMRIACSPRAGSVPRLTPRVVRRVGRYAVRMMPATAKQPVHEHNASNSDGGNGVQRLTRMAAGHPHGWLSHSFFGDLTPESIAYCPPRAGASQGLRAGRVRG